MFGSLCKFDNGSHHQKIATRKPKRRTKREEHRVCGVRAASILLKSARGPRDSMQSQREQMRTPASPAAARSRRAKTSRAAPQSVPADESAAPTVVMAKSAAASPIKAGLVRATGQRALALARAIGLASPFAAHAPPSPPPPPLQLACTLVDSLSTVAHHHIMPLYPPTRRPRACTCACACARRWCRLSGGR